MRNGYFCFIAFVLYQMPRRLSNNFCNFVCTIFFVYFCNLLRQKQQNFSIFLNARERKHICTVDKIFHFGVNIKGERACANFLANVDFAKYLPIVFSRLETLRSPQSTLPIRLISKTINKVYQTQKANENCNKRLALQ